MPAVRLEDVRGQNGADVWLGAALAHLSLLDIVPSVRSDLTDLRLVVVRVQIEVAILSHDVNAGLLWVFLSVLVDASAKCFDLLRLKVDVQADEVRVARGVGQIGLAHVEQSIDLLHEFGAHLPRCYLSRNRVELLGKRIVVDIFVALDAGLAVDCLVDEVLASRERISLHGKAVVGDEIALGCFGVFWVSDCVFNFPNKDCAGVEAEIGSDDLYRHSECEKSVKIEIKLQSVAVKITVCERSF